MTCSDIEKDSHITIQNLSCSPCTEVGYSLPIDLRWNFAVDKASYFNIYVHSDTLPEPRFLGQCASYTYRVLYSRLPLGYTASNMTLTFKVQPVLKSGLTFPLSGLPSVNCDTWNLHKPF